MNRSDAGWVTIAVLGKPRGNRGEVTAWALSSKPERYQQLNHVFLFSGGADCRTLEVESTWFHQGTLIFKFRGIDDISGAESLARSEVRVPMAERTPLDPGEFFEDDLVGCAVIDRRTGESLGEVAAWDDSGGCGNLVVSGGLMIPFARSICVEIDPAARRIVVELPEGLKDLNRP